MSQTELLRLGSVSRHFGPKPNLLTRVSKRIGGQSAPRVVHAVNGVDLEVGVGEVVGLVGESGCGKSTLARLAAGLIDPSSGTVSYRGSDISKHSRAERNAWRRMVQMVFQDPFASLNPRIRIGRAITQAPVSRGLVHRRDAGAAAEKALVAVGMRPDVADRYPHEFSGGQRQRIAIARALALGPELLICDEPVASLDVSVQAQVLNLFMELRQRLGLAMLFVSHDMGVIEHISDRVAVMYLGRIVEMGRTEELFSNPRHPYTRALIAQVPRFGAERSKLPPIRGEIPSPMKPAGCSFHPRCPNAIERCKIDRPALRPVGESALAACHLA
jgi:peptide/nickel transport system ATP-binding protein